MSVVKEPAIKLFGKTIQMHSDEISIQKQYSSGEVDVTKKHEASTQHTILREDHLISENPKTPLPNTNTKDFSDPTETSTTKSDEKTLKKPDKILPCPRCNSMDTKFCYYNNYNLNQPRHFCKNCQRYWTAGGTMRNVPVGSGRRKIKTSHSLRYRNVMVSDDRSDKPDEPLCESMASALNFSDKSTNNVPNKISIQEHDNETLEDHLCGNSSAPALTYPQIPCFPAPPNWPTSWSSGPWTNQMPPPGFCPWTYPVPFYPVPQYWGYTTHNPWENPNSPTLGKHYRDGSNNEGVLIPKTSRINDPNEAAAKSSISSTLGFNNENGESTNESNMCKAFQPNGSNEKNHLVESLPVLQANPAALSRSLNFQETS